MDASRLTLLACYPGFHQQQHNTNNLLLRTAVEAWTKLEITLALNLINGMLTLLSTLMKSTKNRLVDYRQNS